MYCIKPVTVLERFFIVTNSHAASFSMKIRFDETSNIFSLKN